jgi:hypothetical protein
VLIPIVLKNNENNDIERNFILLNSIESSYLERDILYNFCDIYLLNEKDN